MLKLGGRDVGGGGIGQGVIHAQIISIAETRGKDQMAEHI